MNLLQHWTCIHLIHNIPSCCNQYSKKFVESSTSSRNNNVWKIFIYWTIFFIYTLIFYFLCLSFLKSNIWSCVIPVFFFFSWFLFKIYDDRELYHFTVELGKGKLEEIKKESVKHDKKLVWFHLNILFHPVTSAI
jgi:hypothetical protein